MLFDKYFINKADSILKEKLKELQTENQELKDRIFVLENTKGEYIEKSKQLLQSIQIKEKELDNLIKAKTNEMSILSLKKKEYCDLVNSYRTFLDDSVRLNKQIQKQNNRKKRK